MKFIKTNGLTLHVSDTGLPDGPALVFINSLGTDFRIWSQVVGEFEPFYRVIRYDKRGHGLSDAPAGPYSLQQHIGDLHELLEKLGIEKVAICGVSVGGMIAQGYCAQHPERVSGLVLSDTAAKIGTAELWNDRIEKVRQGGISKIADAILERWFSAEFIVQRKVELNGWRNMLIRTPVEGYAGTCAAIRDADLTESTRSITVPTLAVGGDQDGATPPDVVRTLTDLMPNSMFKLIENSGHLPSIEQPRIFTGYVNSFLRESGIV